MTRTNDEVVVAVRETIADVLKIPVEEVKIDSVLTDDLGAMSIDFVDMMFRLEAEFQVTFHPGNPLDRLSESFPPDSLSRDGLLTEVGAEVIRRRMPEIETSVVQPGLPLANIQVLYTTQTWVRAVTELLEARPKSCPKCGSDVLRPIRPSVLECEGCHGEVDCPTQSELLTAWAENEFPSSANGGETHAQTPAEA